MANFSFYFPTDMATFEWHFQMPSVSSMTAKAIRTVETDPQSGQMWQTVYTGSFSYAGFTVDGGTAAEKLGAMAGTISTIDLFGNGLIRAHITGLTYDAIEALTYAELQTYVDPGYGGELMSLMLTGNDSVKGSAFDDNLLGYDGNDTISGGARQDTISGGLGNDSVDGGMGTDTLFGDDGNDTIIGGLGRDTMTGGTGNDVFLYKVMAETGVAGAADVIQDFKHLTDKIDLHLLDANVNTIGDQAFKFIGAAAFSSTAGELRWDAATHTLSGDVDGNGIADFAIVLTTTNTVTGVDFIL